MHTQGRLISSTSMPAVILRLVIVVLMAFSSLSLNIQSVNADDDPTPRSEKKLRQSIPARTRRMQRFPG